MLWKITSCKQKCGFFCVYYSIFSYISSLCQDKLFKLKVYINDTTSQQLKFSEAAINEASIITKAFWVTTQIRAFTTPSQSLYKNCWYNL